jgi:hypothetical protein
MFLHPKPADYDGFYFLPDLQDDDTTQFHYFTFNNVEVRGQKVKVNDFGDLYHVVLFKTNEENVPILDETFEAVFIDPIVYAKNLSDMNIYGCVLRKTNTSPNWIENYLTNYKNRVKMFLSES